YFERFIGCQEDSSKQSNFDSERVSCGVCRRQRGKDRYGARYFFALEPAFIISGSSVLILSKVDEELGYDHPMGGLKILCPDS
ncbi:hypothetical protein DY000_02034008, partial [Brassica cretica]